MGHSSSVSTQHAQDMAKSLADVTSASRRKRGDAFFPPLPRVSPLLLGKAKTPPTTRLPQGTILNRIFCSPTPVHMARISALCPCQKTMATRILSDNRLSAGLTGTVDPQALM